MSVGTQGDLGLHETRRPDSRISGPPPVPPPRLAAVDGDGRVMSLHASMDEALLARPRFSDVAADSQMRVQRPRVTPDPDARESIARPRTSDPGAAAAAGQPSWAARTGARIKAGLSDGWNTVTGAVKRTGGMIKDAAVGARDTAVDGLKRTWAGMKWMGGQIVGAAKTAADTAIGGVKWLGNKAVEAAGWAQDKAVKGAHAVAAAPDRVNEAVKTKTAAFKAKYGTGEAKPVPYQAMREQALAAEGSTATVREAQRENAGLEENVRDLKSSVTGAALGMGSTALVGVNAQKALVHMANLRRATNQDTINQDPQRVNNLERAKGALAAADADTAAAIGPAPMIPGAIRPGFDAKGAFRGAGLQVDAAAKLSIARQATGQDSADEWKTKHTLGKQKIDTSPVSSAGPAVEQDADPDAVQAPSSTPNPDLPAAPKADRYKGGLDPTMKAEDVPHASWLGRAGVGVKGAGKALKDFGGYVNGSTSGTEQALVDGDLTKAKRTAMGGLAKEGAGGVLHFLTGGPLTAGTVAMTTKAAVEHGGLALQGIGLGMSKLAGPAASGEEQRQRQEALSSGDRKKEVLEKGVKWQGQENHKDTKMRQDIVDAAATSIEGLRKQAFGEKFKRNFRR